MTRLYFILPLFIIAGCTTKKEVKAPSKPSLGLSYSAPPLDLNAKGVNFVKDLAYNTHDNTILDIFLPDTKSPTPLVIYIHGGGFTHGEKERVYEKHPDIINTLLDNGIAFATIGYRFLQHSNRGVIQSLEDSKLALQFIRYYSESFNIDKKNIACFGTSAGAGTSLWLGLSDDMAALSEDKYSQESTRLVAIGALETQGTYDILRWEEVFESYNIEMSRIPKPMLNELAKFYGVNDSDLLNSEPYVNYRSSVDFLKLMSSDDPPMYIMNKGKDGPPFFTDIQHHPLHAKILKTYADKNGINSIAYIPGLDIEDKPETSLADFLIENLSR